MIIDKIKDLYKKIISNLTISIQNYYYKVKIKKQEYKLILVLAILQQINFQNNYDNIKRINNCLNYKHKYNRINKKNRIHKIFLSLKNIINITQVI